MTLARLRAQVAVVRTLADHIELFARVADVDGLESQVVDEMARLGRRLSEAAASMVNTPVAAVARDGVAGDGD